LLQAARFDRRHFFPHIENGTSVFPVPAIFTVSFQPNNYKKL
jgi:hypothetical protein